MVYSCRGTALPSRRGTERIVRHVCGCPCTLLALCQFYAIIENTLVCLHTLRSAFRPQLGALRDTDAAEANDAILIISIVVRQLLRHSRLLAPATNVPAEDSDGAPDNRARACLLTVVLLLLKRGCRRRVEGLLSR